ncbi:MAG: IS21 family transposase, partial [Tannerella sp.]|nr:IS21 family transposase [Tannerella sp.]
MEAAAGQKKEDPIRARENALHYFGAVPRATVPDSLKPAVTRTGRYEAVLNEDFSPFAGHCGVTVYPARICRPGDRAPVENAVKLACKDIYTGG